MARYFKFTKIPNELEELAEAALIEGRKERGPDGFVTFEVVRKITESIFTR